MKELTVKDLQLVAACGLYCGSCRQYKKGKCPGCKENIKAKWCKIRSCCAEKEIEACSDCPEFADPGKCKKYNTFISKLIGFAFRSDRSLGIDYLRNSDRASFVNLMVENGWVGIPKRYRKKKAE